jgi:hypothetical protein
MRTVLIALLLVGCGSKETTETTKFVPVPTAQGEVPPHQSMAVRLLTDLPACDPARENQLVYVEVPQQFKVCRHTVWYDVAIKGEKGDKGDAGEKGAQGEKGGIDNSALVKTGILCSPKIDQDMAVAGGLDSFVAFWYQLAELRTGDTFVSAGGSGLRDYYAQSGSVLHPGGTVAAAEGAVSLTYDARAPDSFGWWGLTLDRDTLSIKAEYNDTDFTHTFNLTPAQSKCTKKEF